MVHNFDTAAFKAAMEEKRRWSWIFMRIGAALAVCLRP